MHRNISPWGDACAIGHVARILLDEDFDVIHVHSAKAGMIGRIAARIAGVGPVVYTPHAFPFLAGGVQGPIYRALEWAARPLTNHLLAVSHAEARQARLLGFPDTQVSVIENGVKCQLRSTPWEIVGNKRTVIGTAMNFRPQKDYETFVNACSLLRDWQVDYRVVICGNGPQLSYIKRLVAAHELTERIEFAGWVPDAAMRMVSWDVFVLTTHYEGLSYALLEAMIAGRPIVASRVEGVKGVIEDGVSGLLVPPQDPRAVACAVVQLINDPERAHELGKEAHARAIGRFDIRRQMRALEEFYESLERAKRGTDAHV
jgi:glycosyltransferase involved in cell wall biosynthesis